MLIFMHGVFSLKKLHAKTLETVASRGEPSPLCDSVEDTMPPSSCLFFEKYICLLVWLSGVREGYFILVKLKGKTAVRLMPPDGVLPVLGILYKQFFLRCYPIIFSILTQEILLHEILYTVLFQ